MGESKHLILKEPPKKLEYIKKLLNYDPNQTFLEKTKKWITRKDQTRPHSKSEWCEILGSTKNNTSVRNFLDILIEKNVLVYEDTKGQPPNEYDRYKLDKKRLENVFSKDPFWNWIRDISIRTINNQEPNKKVVNDF